MHAVAVSVGIASEGARAFAVRKRARASTLILTLEIPLEVSVDKKKSDADEPIPKWLEGLGSETPEQRLAFRDWMQSSAWSLGEEHQEIIAGLALPHSG